MKASAIITRQQAATMWLTCMIHAQTTHMSVADVADRATDPRGFMHRVLSSTGSGYLHGCFQVALRLPEHAARYSATRDSRTVETTGVAATSCVTRMSSCLKRWRNCSTGARRAPNRSAPISSNQLQSSALALAGNPERKNEQQASRSNGALFRRRLLRASRGQD